MGISPALPVIQVIEYHHFWNTLPWLGDDDDKIKLTNSLTKPIARKLKNENFVCARAHTFFMRTVAS